MDLVEKTKNLHRHPWEMSRADNIIKVLENNSNDIVIADVGSGDQYFSKKLTEFTKHDVVAVDKEYKDNQTFDPRIKCLNDIGSLNDRSIDYIFLMDVLEHIDDDLEFLTDLSKKLKIGGRLIITVPAWQFLFSRHDIYLKHFRRYNFNQLRELILKTDLNIVYSHYFYSILLPSRIIAKMMEKLLSNSSYEDQKGIGLWKYNKDNVITKAVYFLLNLDFRLNQILNRLKIRLPGLSLLAVVKKTNK